MYCTYVDNDTMLIYKGIIVTKLITACRYAIDIKQDSLFFIPPFFLAMKMWRYTK